MSSHKVHVHYGTEEKEDGVGPVEIPFSLSMLRWKYLCVAPTCTSVTVRRLSGLVGFRTVGVTEEERDLEG